MKKTAGMMAEKKAAGGPFPTGAAYTRDTVNAGTTGMKMHNRVNRSGFSKLFSRLMLFMMRRANLKKLKHNPEPGKSLPNGPLAGLNRPGLTGSLADFNEYRFIHFSQMAFYS